MATFVDTSTEEEQILTLVQYVTNLKKKADPEGESAGQFKEEATRLVQESRTKDVILKLIGETDAIFQQDHNDKEIEACLSVISALIRKMEPEFTSGAQKLREAVASNTTDRPSLRLKIITNLYHAFDAQSVGRYETFMTLARYAHESKNAELMIPKFKRVDQWLEDWGASIEQKRKLFLLIRRILKDNNMSAESHKYLVKSLQTFEGKGNETSEELTSLAVEAILEAISFEDLFQCDHLLSLSSVKALQNDPAHGNLYTLLNIFAREKLDGLQAFVAAHAGFLESKGINVDQAFKKIRLLSIASLGSEAREIPYAVIASTLQVPATEVESWIIEAVSAKLLEAKMNQLKQVVSVGFCVQRVFGKEQWTSLANSLKKWQSSVSQLLTTVNQIQEVQVQ